jgi:hypothetical protein
VALCSVVSSMLHSWVYTKPKIVALCSVVSSMLHSWVYTKSQKMHYYCLIFLYFFDYFRIDCSRRSLSFRNSASADTQKLILHIASESTSWAECFLQRYSLALRITVKFIKVCCRIFIDMMIKCEVFVQCNTKISYYAEHKVNRMTTKINSDMFWNFALFFEEKTINSVFLDWEWVLERRAIIEYVINTFHFNSVNSMR